MLVIRRPYSRKLLIVWLRRRHRHRRRRWKFDRFIGLIYLCHCNGDLLHFDTWSVNEILPSMIEINE